MAIILTGDNLNNILTAGSNVDYWIYGNGGNDTLNGSGGNDILDGGTGNDSMSGGLGNDTYVVDSSGDIVNEFGGGTDLVQSSVSFSLAPHAFVENLTLTGTAYSATGNALNNKLTGNASGNWIDGGTGVDTMTGGAGSDYYTVDNASDSVVENAGEGTDWVYASVTDTLAANVENLDLTGANAIDGYGNDLANLMYGNGANNVLNGHTGNDTMYGQGGNDSYYVNSSLDVASESGGSGTDRVYSNASSYTLGTDIENMTLQEQTIYVPPGSAFGLIIAAGVNGTGNGLANSMSGNSVANQLSGAAGNDWLYGNGGNDTLDGGTGNDYLAGGVGNDVYIADSATDLASELAGEGVDRVEASVSFNLGTQALQVENLTLTGASNLSGYGNALANTMTGNTGSNYIDGGAGGDLMLGGQGSDTYVVDSGADLVSESAGEGSDWVYAGVSFAIADVDVENMMLTGAAAISGTGNASANSLYGNGANNTLTGQGGNDYLYANAGNDILQGGTGADSLIGSSGSDTLRGVDGAVDDLNEDRFVFDATLSAATNVDLIDRANFTAAGAEGTDDQVMLENGIFTALRSVAATTSGTLGSAYYFEGAGLTGNGQFDQTGIYNNTSTGQLFYNAGYNDGLGSVLFAVVSGVNVVGGSAALSAEEFTLV
jgi:Ca2+-binding RTX toxin-like protein